MSPVSSSASALLDTLQGTGTPSSVRPLTPRPPLADATDPFQEPPEPRLPRGATPEERNEFFRALLKQKDETLAKARFTYGQQKVENDGLREKLAAAMGELEATEADRRDLSLGLAEVEAQLAPLRSLLDDERKARAELAEELIGAKEALSGSQDRAAAIATAKSEVEGELEAVSEQLQRLHRDNDELAADLEAAHGQISQLTSQRDAAVSGASEAETERIAELEVGLAEANKRASQLEDVLDVARSAKSEADARITVLEEEGAELGGKVDTLEAQLTKERERAGRLEVRAERSTQLEARLAELEEERRRTRDENQALVADLEMLKVEAENAKRLRDELALASRKANDGGAVVQRERREREVVESKLAERDRQVGSLAAKLEGSEVDLQRAVAERQRAEELVQRLEAELARVKDGMSLGASAALPTGPAHPIVSAADAEVFAEREKLKEDNAKLKQKLIQAENALEAAAVLRAKVQRLESMLKGTRS